MTVARYAPPLTIIVLVFLCFSPALSNNFVNWDDHLNFLDNPHYRGLSRNHLQWMFTTTHTAHYQPVTWVTHSLVYAIWGIDPLGYHLVNLLLHAANAVLFYLLVVALLRQGWSAEARSSDPGIVAAAAVGALFFAIHPLRVEPVAWATERHRVLSGFFLLLSLLSYLRMHAVQPAGRRAALPWFALSIGCYALSLLSEATGVTLPVILLALDFCPLARFSNAADTRARVAVFVEKVPYAVLAGGAAAVALAAEQPFTDIAPADRGLVARTLQAAYGLCFYLWKTLVPTRLSPMYLLKSTPVITEPTFILSIAAVVAITTVLIILLRRYPWGFTAWGCYVVLLSPNLGFVPGGPQIAADRYTYLPCLPWAVLAAAGMYRLLLARDSGRLSRPVWYAAAAGVTLGLAGLGVRTYQQTRLWNDSFILWDHAVQIDPTDFVAYNGRGSARQVAGDLNGALDDFNRSIQLNPHSADAYDKRGAVRQVKGDLDGAVADFSQALRLDPKHAAAYVSSRARARRAKGDLDGAMADSNEAIRLDPHSAAAYFDRGTVRKAKGDLEGAIGDFTQTVSIDPQFVNAYNNRAIARQARGDLEGAIADYQQALHVAPPDAPSRATFERNLAAARQAAERGKTP